MKILPAPDKRLTWLFNLSALLILSTVIFTFFDKKDGRIFFFISSYLAAFGMLYRRLSLSRSEYFFIGSLFLLGLSKVVWFGIEYIGQPDFDIYNSYLASGKRVMIAAFIALFLLGNKRLLSPVHAQFIKYGLLVALLVATCVGGWQILHHVDRVDFYQGRATDASYMYAGLATAVIFMLLQDANQRWHYLVAAGVFILAFLMISATETRNTMASFPLALLIIGVLKFRHFGWKGFAIVFVTLFVLIAASYKLVIAPRVATTVQEYQTFEQSEGNDLGSLTTRLAMWNVGLKSFAAHPFGMSQEDRTQWFKDYVATTHKDKSSLAYVNIHLHDELIETASLQGILGLAVLIFYYITNLTLGWRYRNPAFLSVVLVVMLSGLTDVIFISRDQTIFFPVLMLLTLLWQLSRPAPQVTS
ncbi:O-antigen ligase family protein [Candidatus Pantoea multigeneris]|uniref:O-antigen ligase family protein n=1 Tax=Candidatus Pantoea multigeneris TaxID=2608357 RepID=A0ABX0RGC7_9GAMM|nr:O-antigen ligase family protein [Pantoea multigeneris]NIF24117.1 O-antigen ligase family protein [Pantoea multigeneris]